MMPVAHLITINAETRLSTPPPPTGLIMLAC